MWVIVLFDLPHTPIVSLGALQHADTSKHNNHPARSIGNSRPQVGQPDQTKIKGRHFIIISERQLKK